MSTRYAKTVIAFVLIALTALLLPGGVSADATFSLPSPCSGYMVAHTPYFDSFAGGVTAVGDFHCDQYQTAHPFKVSLWYFYTSTGAWGQANSLDETMTGYDDGASVSQCAAYDATTHKWKTRVNWGGGYATESIAIIHYKKTC